MNLRFASPSRTRVRSSLFYFLVLLTSTFAWSAPGFFVAGSRDAARRPLRGLFSLYAWKLCRAPSHTKTKYFPWSEIPGLPHFADDPVSVRVRAGASPATYTKNSLRRESVPQHPWPVRQTDARPHQVARTEFRARLALLRASTGLFSANSFPCSKMRSARKPSLSLALILKRTSAFRTPSGSMISPS